MVYVGTCGYSYKDWIGPFYPPRTTSLMMLPFYAQHFGAVEVDSTYYAVPEQRTFASMDARTPPEFRFSVKAPATVTHPPGLTMLVHEDAARLLEALAPLRDSGKLACILAQFPNAFAATESNREYVQRVVAALAGVPVVVEFRRRDWQTSATLSFLREIGAGYCNVDMPAYGTLLRPSADATSDLGYVRLHGRNAAMWWKGTNVTRYDYLYSNEELAAWSDRIADVATETAQTLVFFNNHARGQAPTNARTLAAMLRE